MMPEIPLEDLKKWVGSAPLPVVLTITLALSAWVYVIASDQRVDAVKAENVAAQVDRMDTKLDKLLDSVAELKAEQRQSRYDLRFGLPPTPQPRKEK